MGCAIVRNVSLVLAATAGLDSSSQSLMGFGRKEWRLYSSGLHMAKLL